MAFHVISFLLAVLNRPLWGGEEIRQARKGGSTKALLGLTHVDGTTAKAKNRRLALTILIPHSPLSTPRFFPLHLHQIPACASTYILTQTKVTT